MEGMSFWQQDGEAHWVSAFGHYHETFEKRNDRWVFTWRKLTYYHTSKSPGAISRRRSTIDPAYQPVMRRNPDGNRVRS